MVNVYAFKHNGCLVTPTSIPTVIILNGIEYYLFLAHKILFINSLITYYKRCYDSVDDKWS